jgi:hypothetical protein
VDIYLEIMNEREAKQLFELARPPTGPDAPNVRNFLERHVRRHTARVFLQNRQGYKLR